MTKRYGFWLYKNLHTEPYVERQSSRLIQTTWDQLEPMHDSLEAAKHAAGDETIWLPPIPGSKPEWLLPDMEWLQTYEHLSVDGEWRILQYGIEAT